VKGRHAQARRRRDAAAAAAVVQRLRGEIEAETGKARAAAERAAQSRIARARLEQEQRSTERQLSPPTEQTGALAAAVGPGLAALSAARSELRAATRKLSTIADHRSAGQVKEAGFKLHLVGIHRSADVAYGRVWYQKHHHESLDSIRRLSVDGWVPTDLPYDRASLAPYMTSTVHDTTPQAQYAWSVSPWLRPPTDTSDAPALRARLGAISSGTPRLTEPITRATIRQDATINTPWRHAPGISQAADAADLAYWYRRSSHAQGWRTGGIPVPFWLPAEHSVSYPQARPLPDGTELRLPYPDTFVAFAAPWELKPEPVDELAPDDVLRTLMLYARGRAAAGKAETLDTVLSRLHAAGHIDRDELPTPLQALGHFGGSVEGLIFTADQNGHPEDEFAWCIAVNHPTGLPLARIVVPASRAQTVWRHQVDSVLAGVALSCWHEPYDRESLNAARAITAGDANGEDLAVHILDVDATSPTATQSDRRSGHTPRAHLRRGHWRRQRVGPGGSETRWTWVRPTTVGGSTTATRQVYVLPVGPNHNA